MEITEEPSRARMKGKKTARREEAKSNGKKTKISREIKRTHTIPTFSAPMENVSIDGDPRSFAGDIAACPLVYGFSRSIFLRKI